MFKSILAWFGLGQRQPRDSEDADRSNTMADRGDHGGPERADAAAADLKQYLDAQPAKPDLHMSKCLCLSDIDDPLSHPGSPEAVAALKQAYPQHCVTGAAVVADLDDGVSLAQIRGRVEDLVCDSFADPTTPDGLAGLPEIVSDSDLGLAPATPWIRVSELTDDQQKMLFNSTRMRRNRTTKDMSEAAAYAKTVVAEVTRRLATGAEAWVVAPDLTDDQQLEFDVVHALAKLSGADADACRHQAYFAAYRLGDRTVVRDLAQHIVTA